MADLIDRQAVFNALPVVEEDKKISLYGAVADFMVLVSALPVVDAVEVVRCKDCEWGGKCEVECLLREIDKIADPYCAAGKRREENAD